MKCLGYVIESDENTFTVVLPEKPTGVLKVKLQQANKRIDADTEDVYSLKAFDIEFADDGTPMSWSKTKISDLCTETYFLAYLADGRILGKSGKSYILYDSGILTSKCKDMPYHTHMEYLLAQPISSIANLKLYVRNNIVYGVVSCQAYVYRESWSVEDSLFDYLTTFGRYYDIRNTGKVIMISTTKRAIETQPSSGVTGLVGEKNAFDILDNINKEMKVR